MGRLEKVNQQLKREISEIIHRELQDPRLNLVTITSADVSKDLRYAKVYFTVLGDKVKMDNAQKAMTGARGIIRKYVGDRMKMRFTPELMFVYDETIELKERMDQTFKEIHEESDDDNSDD